MLKALVDGCICDGKLVDGYLVRWPHTSRGKDWPSKNQGAHGEGPRAPREKTLELANDGLGKSETGRTIITRISLSKFKKSENRAFDAPPSPPSSVGRIVK